jgi:uncharacterized RDD family membrane protein YckC
MVVTSNQSPGARPPLGRRVLAGVIDLYHFFYVALLPFLLMAAAVVLLEERMIEREVARARAMPKGRWTDDPGRATELSRKRSAFFKGLGNDLWNEVQNFLNSLAPRLDEDTRFKDSLDKLIKHPYTELSSETVQRGLQALKRHVRTPDGAAALDKLERFVTNDLGKRLTAQIQEELDYRISQVADFLGFQGIGERVRSWIRSRPGGAVEAERVPEALQWTNLLDKVLLEKVAILPETRDNLALLRIAALVSVAIGFLYLALRDLVGRGRSFGKQQAGLRIVDARTYAPATNGQLLVRGLLLVVLLPLEILLAAADLRLGDRIAGTRLVAD